MNGDLTKKHEVPSRYTESQGAAPIDEAGNIEIDKSPKLPSPNNNIELQVRRS